MIKEFDLDAPAEEKWDRVGFRDATRCTTALFERLYTPSKNTGRPWKVLIEVYDDDRGSRVTDVGGVLTTSIAGSVRAFSELDSDGKKRRTLHWLMTGLRQVAKSERLDERGFEIAARLVEEAKFVNQLDIGRSKRNPSKEISAQLQLDHDVEQATILVSFRDKKGAELARVPLVSDRPNEFIFSQYLGSFAWVDNETVKLKPKGQGPDLFAQVPKEG